MNKDQQADFDKKYSPEQYTQTTYSFSTGELRRLLQLDTIVSMGQMASMMLSNLVNNGTLQRVGVKASPDIGVIYDVEKGEVYIKTPKNWCSLCQNRKAEYKYAEKVYCTTCVEAVRKQSEKKKPKEVKK